MLPVLLFVLQNAPSPRSRHGICIWQKAFIVFGGITAGGYSNELSKFVLVTSTWVAITNTGNAPSPRGSSGLTAINDILYTFGGITEIGFSDELYAGVLSGEGSVVTWKLITTGDTTRGPTARSGHALFVFQGSLFLFGGWRDTLRANADGSQGVYFNNLIQFDCAKEQWLGLVSVPAGVADETPTLRRDMGVVVFKESMIVFDGSSGDFAGVPDGFVGDIRTRGLPREWL